MNRKQPEYHRTTIYLGRQHEDLLDYIVLTLKRSEGVRISKSDIIRSGIELIARMKDSERLDLFR